MMPKIKKPKNQVKQKISQEEFESKVVELSKSGLTSEKIGEVLRKDGIHSKEFQKKISQILKEKDFYVNPDIKNVELKLTRIEKHSKIHKKDRRAMRERERVFAQLRKLREYFNIKKV